MTGGSTTMSDSDTGGATNAGGRTTSGGGGMTSGMSSGGSKTSLTESGGPKAPTTTISTIAVQSGNTRIVLALLQSAEWLELRVVELTPGMCVLGSTLEETQALQRAHEDVLSKLQSKQSPVEDLLNQADQLISTQRPRAEVYAAMAESLGLAWKNLNGQLDTRKQVLDMSLAFHTRARQYSNAMDAAERLYTDNVLPGEAETVRQLLAKLHDHKRNILEASMYTLQEAQQLLNRLKSMATEGATLDSRPHFIRTNIDFACSQVEHYLESLHDRRRFLDGIFSARKHHLDQCLSLCILYQELTIAVTNLKKLRDEVSQHQSLGESQNNTEILLHEHLKREQAAKEQQDKCIHLLKTAEGMCNTGHYAGVEARGRSYSVLEAATALHETCDTRTALLQQSILFFKLANTALTKFDQAEVQVATLTAEGSQRLSVVVGIVEEAVQPALTEGYAILEVTGGRNQPHNMGISEMIELLERRRANLSSLCVTSTEQVLQRTELSNSFLEQYNSIESWLSRIGDAFLQGHQDPGGSLSLAKDFLHLHLTLNNDVMEKKIEIDALVQFLEQITPEINSEDTDSFHEKIKSLMNHWTSLKNLLDVRIQLSEKYVKFHEDAEAVTNELEALELLLRDAKGEDRTAQIEAKWELVQKMYLDLTNSGKSFCLEAKNAQDQYLDVNRAVLCVENILEHLGKRRLVVTDLHSHYYQKITVTKEMITMWKTYRENVTKMHKEMSGLETDFCPLLRGNTINPELLAENLENRLSIYVQAIKKSQEDIQNMMTRAEVMSYKGDEGGQRDEVISSLLQLYQNLQNKATEFQILSHMLMQFLKNISEIHRSCDKLENQFGAVALDIGGVEGQMLEHEASRQAVLELLNYARKEADAIIKKIRDECPTESGSQDIAIIEDLLQRRGKTFEEAWTIKQAILEKQLKRSQYHVDLQVISDQLRDLSEQLGRMRGNYGDSLGASMNMQNAFGHFQITVDMLEKRIHTFTSTAIRMLGSNDNSGEIKSDIEELENKWSTFHMQVGHSKKSIEISIEFFRLVEEVETWFKEGSRLLVAVAGESANVKSPEQAESLKSRIDVFLKSGKGKQQERINKISSLGIQLYGDAAPRQVEMITQQNIHMLESFTVINQNIISITENLKISKEQRKEQEKHNQDLANKLSAAQAEAEVAKLATAAAEEARRAAEEVARNLAIPIEPVLPKMVEVNIQTEAQPLDNDAKEAPLRKDQPPPKKVKLIDDEPQHMAPVFITPLVGATVTEGIKFTFETKVVGFPIPKIEWFKDGMNISTNPDYKTSTEEGLCKLTIEETFTEDTAKFTCRASNASGVAETSANLIIKEAEPIEVLSPPVFVKQLLDSSALEGASYQLEAKVQGNPLPVVAWAKNGACVDESPDYVITYNNGECVLRFEEVFLEDQAEYVCKATNDLGEDTTKAKLKVTAVEVSERPKFSMPLSNVMARAGQKFKLECHVTGTPTPTLTWFHNSKPIRETLDVKITFDGRVATLVTLEAFPKNAGTYSAKAKNTAGEAQVSCNVSVKGRIPTETSDSELASDIDVDPVKPSVHLALKDMSVKEGKSARLDCVIIGQPEPEVVWYHDDKPVKESTDFKLLFHGDRCSLVIQEAFLEDAGIYRVAAMNSAGEASTAAFLNIEPSPELSPSAAAAPTAAPELPPAVAPRFSALLTDSHVTESESATLRAAVTGTPTPTLAWFREGLPLIPDNQLQIHENPDGNLSVNIPSTTLDHTGQYEVVATNSAGTAKCVAYLSIETRLPTPPPPAPREPPTFTKLITDTQVVNGHPALFEAEVTGQPMPTVSVSPSLNGYNGSQHASLIRVNQNTSHILNNISVNDARDINQNSVSINRGKDICNQKETPLSNGIHKYNMNGCDNVEKGLCQNNNIKAIDKMAKHEINFNNLMKNMDSEYNSATDINSCDFNFSNSEVSIMPKDEYSAFMAHMISKENSESSCSRPSSPYYNLYMNDDSNDDGFDSGRGESCCTSVRESCCTSVRESFSSQVSPFQDLEVLGLDAYSQYLKDNNIICDEKNLEESSHNEARKEKTAKNGLINSNISDDHQSYISFEEMKNARVINSKRQQKANYKKLAFVEPGEYSSLIASNFESEVFRVEAEDPCKPLFVDVSFQSDSGAVSCIESPVDKQEPISFLDTGIAQDLKPVKLCDLWNLIKHNISKVSDEDKCDSEQENVDEINGPDEFKDKPQELRNEYLSLESDELKASGTQNQFKPSDDNNNDPKNTTEDITDSIEMESGYYSGNFLSFSSLIDEDNDTRNLASRDEIQNSIDPQSSQSSIAISNSIESQSNNFSLAITNISVEEIPPIDSDSDTWSLDVNGKYKAESSSSVINHRNFHPMDQPIIEMPESPTEKYNNQMFDDQGNESLKEYNIRYFSDEDISETSDCESQTYRTFHEQYEPQESSQQVLPGAVGGLKSKYHHSSIQSGETRQSDSMWEAGNIAKGQYMGAFDAIPEYSNLRPSSVLSDISEEGTYHVTSEESDTTLDGDSALECSNGNGNNDRELPSYESSPKDSDSWSYGIAVYGVPNDVSSGTEEFEQMEREILGTSNEYNYSTSNITNHVTKNEGCPKDQGNEAVNMAGHGELNNLRPQINVTKHESVQPQMICFTNEDIKSSHSRRCGTKHLEGLRRLTMMLKQPSKLSIMSNENKKLELLNIKNIQKIQKRVLHSFSETVESSRISFNSEIPGDNTDGLFSEEGGIFSFVIQAKENLSLSQLHLLIKEKIQKILNAGYSLVREYVLPVSNESENKETTESLLTRALESVNIENLEQFAFDTCLLATRSQDAMLGGEIIDFTTPGLLQAGYYLIYVVFFKEDS